MRVETSPLETSCVQRVGARFFLKRDTCNHELLRIEGRDVFHLAPEEFLKSLEGLGFLDDQDGLPLTWDDAIILATEDEPILTVRLWDRFLGLVQGILFLLHRDKVSYEDVEFMLQSHFVSLVPPEFG
jgi:hypothetical protein